jgi:hypothetical protein
MSGAFVICGVACFLTGHWAFGLLFVWAALHLYQAEST